MQPFPTTQWSFIDEVGCADGDNRLDLTEKFLLRYFQPMRNHLGIKFRNVQEADLDDLIHDFVTDHIIQKSILEHARKDRGKLRSLLRVSLSNYAINWLKKHNKHIYIGVSESNDFGLELNHRGNTTDRFDLEWARFILTQAIGQLKKDCLNTNKHLMWDVFQHRALQPIATHTPPESYSDLSKKMNVEPKRLENLLISAKRMLHRKLHNVVRGYTTSESEAKEEIRDLWAIASYASKNTDHLMPFIKENEI